NAWLPAVTVTRSGVVPATATAWNAGVIWDSAGFAPDHKFRLIADYFDIETRDEFRRLATHNQILEAVWSTTDAFNQCTHPLAARVKYNVSANNPTGTCTDADGPGGPTPP